MTASYRALSYLVWEVDLYNQANVLKVETVTRLIPPWNREGIRKLLRGERGVDE